MDEILEFVNSFNKISLIFFFITFGFLVYVIYLFSKENKKKDTPKLPDFKEGSYNASQISQLSGKSNELKMMKKPSQLPIIISAVVIFLILTQAVFNYLKLQKSQTRIKKIVDQTVINTVVSKGIIIYDNNWVAVSDRYLSNLRGQSIYISIEAPKQADIDMARIKINEKKWTENSVVFNYKKERNVFFREYKIASNESILTIEAQLHSKKDGWLGY